MEHTITRGNKEHVVYVEVNTIRGGRRCGFELDIDVYQGEKLINDYLSQDEWDKIIEAAIADIDKRCYE